ncbi:MAG: autotransporter outer rane beta-barrel protein, partial [Verrucomicrobiales bacterium]|nr:autotransporter outer rane beta-barrel protein [Verrucomicrobiales bacterium]
MLPLLRRPLLGLIGLVPALASAQTTYDWTSATPAGFVLTDSANWTKGGADPDGFPNSNTAIAQLMKDWAAAPAWTLDGNLLTNKLIYDDTGATGDVAGIINAGTGGILTLGGTAPQIDVRTGSLTINAELSANGLTKTGSAPLILTGGNPNLTGTLTVANVAATNNNGVQFFSLASMGALTNIAIQGTPTTGGYVGIRNGITVPASVSWAVSSQGGNSAPEGAIRGQGGQNVINGTIALNTANIRLANVGGAGSSLTLNGAITAAVGSGIAPIFRFGQGDGIAITNTSNYWEGLTIHSQDVFRFAPGSLPVTSSLQMTASASGHIETTGSLTRALGNGANQMYISTSNDAARGSGWSARGGALDLNIGGAAADVKFFEAFTKTATFATASNQVTVTNATGLVPGMLINVTGYASGTTITGISGNVLTVSANSTAAGTGVSPSFILISDPTRINTNNLVLNGSTADSTLTLANSLDVNGFNRTVQTNAANVTTVFAGGLKNSGAASATLTKSGAGILEITGAVEGAVGITPTAGTVILGGSTTNTFTGNVNLNGGNVIVRKDSGLGAVGGGVTTNGLTNGNTLIFDSAGGPLNIAESTLTLSMRRANNANSVFALAPNIRSIGNNNVTLSGNLQVTSGGAVAMIESAGSGLLRLTGTMNSNATATRHYRLQGSGNGEVSATITNGTADALVISKQGTGTWTLTKPDQSFTNAATVISNGVLSIGKIADNGADSSIGRGRVTDGANGLRFESGTLRYTGGGDTTDRQFTIEANGGTLDSSGSGALQFTNILPHAVRTITTFTGSYASGGTVVANNDAGWMKPGMLLTAGGLNAEITSINVSAGTLTISTPTTTGSGTGEFTNVTVAKGSANLDRTFTLTGSNTGGNLIAGILPDATDFGGGILSLQKSGTGTWNLGGINTFTGATTVTDGRLNLTATGAVTGNVNATGGTFSGLGTVGGLVTTTDATLQLGDGVTRGTLTVAGAVSLDAASVLRLTIDDETSMDRLANGGTFSSTGALLDITFNDPTFIQATSAADWALATR